MYCCKPKNMARVQCWSVSEKRNIEYFISNNSPWLIKLWCEALIETLIWCLTHYCLWSNDWNSNWTAPASAVSSYHATMQANVQPTGNANSSSMTLFVFDVDNCQRTERRVTATQLTLQPQVLVWSEQQLKHTRLNMFWNNDWNKYWQSLAPQPIF